MAKRKLKLDEIVMVQNVTKGPPNYKYRVMVREKAVGLFQSRSYADLLANTLKRLIMASELVGERRLIHQILLMTDFLTTSEEILKLGIKSKRPSKSGSKII